MTISPNGSDSNHPDLRTIDFTITETFHDFWEHWKHYTRRTDNDTFEPCPLGDGCLGFPHCTAEKAYEKVKTSGIE